MQRADFIFAMSIIISGCGLIERDDCASSSAMGDSPTLLVTFG